MMASASPTWSDGRTLMSDQLLSSPTGICSSGRPDRMARCSALVVKMPRRGGCVAASCTSTLVVRSCWNTLTTETMSVAASTMCAGRTKAWSTRAMFSACSSLPLCRWPAALSLAPMSENSSAPNVALAAISSCTVACASA